MQISKSVPDTTSTDALAGYVDGKLLRAGRGKAWRDIMQPIAEPGLKASTLRRLWDAWGSRWK
jgi:hypothetical protein